MEGDLDLTNLTDHIDVREGVIVEFLHDWRHNSE